MINSSVVTALRETYKMYGAVGPRTRMKSTIIEAVEDLDTEKSIPFHFIVTHASELYF